MCRCPSSHRRGRPGGVGHIYTCCPRAPEAVPRPVPTYSPHRKVTVAQRWTESWVPGRSGPGPHHPAAPNSLPFRDPLEAWSQAPAYRHPARGWLWVLRDRWTRHRQTASCGWGPGSVCPVSPSWWVRPHCLCAELPCHVPCVNARDPAAPTAGKLAFIEALTSALCSCGRRLGGVQVGAGTGWTLPQGAHETRSSLPCQTGDSLPQDMPSPGPTGASAPSWEAHGGGGQSSTWCQGPESKHTAASACVVSVLCFYIYIYISIILLKKEKESFRSFP